MKEILQKLDSCYKKEWEKKNGRKIEDWWPVSGKFQPKELEIAVGAVLTQNTNWRNVEKALRNMEAAGLVTAKKISACKKEKLQQVIRPAGFFTQKADRLKALCRFVVEHEDFWKSAKREELLAIKGIGPETADSILLYALGKKEFVVDAYTRRVFSRLGILDEDMKYDEIKKIFETEIRKNTRKYKVAHALIVEHSKRTCRKKPLCGVCSLGRCTERNKIL